MNNISKNFIIWAVVFILVIALFNMFQGGFNNSGLTRLAFSDFMARVDNGEITSVAIQGDRVSTSTGAPQVGVKANQPLSGYYTDVPANYGGLVDKLEAKDVKIDVLPDESGTPSLMGVILSWLPFLVILGIWIFFMRQMQGGGGKAMGFGKSRAKLLTERTGKITFDDVAGIDEAKEELGELVEYLKDPQKFQKLGGKIPKGCLLVGPPGTGKTLLARAIAGEADVPFFTISGSDFVEMFVGVGASRVRDMFEQAKRNAPCIVFIDEIDAVGRHRGFGLGGGNDEREQTLNQLLVEMDGFEANEGVIIIAATNRPDVLDPALLRPGRFDRQITVPNPDINGREQILKVHMKKVPLGPDVEPRVIARGTPGFSGADLSNLVNEAALLAARRGKKVVTMVDFEYAKDKVMMGAERRSMVMSEEEKKLTAYHESGHAIVAIHSPASDPVHKATIIPRGRALGMVMRLPEGDKYSVTREKMKADLAVAMGGRVAEELIFGYDKVTSGASSDIQYATRMARGMVAQWGMSDKLGPQFFGDEQQEVYLGHSMGMSRNCSPATAQLIDEEVKAIIDASYSKAQDILIKHRDQLELLAQSLLEHETLSGDEIKILLDGGTINRNSDDSDGKPKIRKSSLPGGKHPSGRKKKEGDEPDGLPAT